MRGEDQSWASYLTCVQVVVEILHRCAASLEVRGVRARASHVGQRRARRPGRGEWGDPVEGSGGSSVGESMAGNGAGRQATNDSCPIGRLRVIVAGHGRSGRRPDGDRRGVRRGVRRSGWCPSREISEVVVRGDEVATPHPLRFGWSRISTGGGGEGGPCRRPTKGKLYTVGR